MKNKTHAANLELARRIRAAGIPIDVPEDDPEAPMAPINGVLICQTGGVIESAAYDFYGGAAFTVSLIITIQRYSFAISAFSLEVPWEDTVTLLEDPLERDGVSEVYRFGGKDQLEFHRDQVLNHHADELRILPYGSSVEGMLLGVGWQPIPDGYSAGTMIPAFVTVTDQFTNTYRSSVSLLANRREEPRGGPRKRKLKPIFECRDPVPLKRSQEPPPWALTRWVSKESVSPPEIKK